MSDRSDSNPIALLWANESDVPENPLYVLFRMGLRDDRGAHVVEYGVGDAERHGRDFVDGRWLVDESGYRLRDERRDGKLWVTVAYGPDVPYRGEPLVYRVPITGWH